MLLGVLLILFFAGFLYLVSRNLLWGLIFIAAFLPAYLIRFEVLGVPFTVLEGMILITFIVWFLRRYCHFERASKRVEKSLNNRERDSSTPLRSTRNDSKTEWFLAVGLFLLAATVAVFVSPNLRAALGIWKAYFIEPALFFLVLVTTVKNRDEAEKIIWGLVLGSLPMAILAVIQKFTGWLIPNPFWAAEATRRVTSVFGYPNAVALYLAPILPFAFYFMEHGTWNMEHKIWKRSFMLCVIFFMLLAIIFAQSTGAILALAVVAAITGLVYKRIRYWVIGAVVLFFLIIPFTSFREPLSQEVFLRGRSGQIRLAMWGETVEMLRAHPIFGAGLAGYQSAVGSYHILNWAEIYLYPHNLFLNFWTETGVFGLVSFLWLVVLFFKLGFRKLSGIWEATKINKRLIAALMASMTIILVHGFVDVPYFKNDLSVMFWIFLGLALV